MKRFSTMLVVSLLAFAPAYGSMFVWDGGTALSGTSWTNPINWDQNSSYPGDASGGGDADTATIDMTYSPSKFPVLSQDETIASLDMYDGSSSTPVTLEVSSTYALTVSGDLTIGDAPGAGGSESYVEFNGAGDVCVGGSIVFQAPDDNATTITVTGNGAVRGGC